MKLASIPSIYRNFNRAVEIFSILSKYGLARWVSRFDLTFAARMFRRHNGKSLASLAPAQRVRHALTELGPTFIKLGQILSTRADLVGVELAGELERLQDDAPADSAAAVQQLIESELGRPLHEIFAEFDDQPLASASIAQVHRARLINGDEVVVKVQHPDAERIIRVDLEILSGIAQLAGRLKEFRQYRPEATVLEFRRTILRELDFARELRNLQRFAADFADVPYVRFPRPYPELSTSRVLTMQRLQGIKLSDAASLRHIGLDKAEIARRGAQVFLDMVFTHGFYHADPHPGNILLLPGNVIGLLDCGMVGRIDERLRDAIEEMLLAIGNRDGTHLAAIIRRVCVVPPDIDQATLTLDVADFVAHYTNQPLNTIDFSGAINELVEMIRRYQIAMPARLAVLLKVLVMLEGTARLISPKFSLTEVLAPFQKKLLLRRLSPRRQWRKMQRVAGDVEQLVEVLPRGIMEILEQVQSGKFDIHLDHRGLEPSVNRVVLGMMTSFLFLGSSILLATHAPPLIYGNVSLLGAAGCLISMVWGLRLFWAIWHSGRYNRPE
jgi:ubiquinone biosynthesis protein